MAQKNAGFNDSIFWIIKTKKPSYFSIDFGFAFTKMLSLIDILFPNMFTV